MTSARRHLLRLELSAALRLGVIGDLWAASVARRLRKLSGEPSGNSKPQGENTSRDKGAA